MDSSPEESQQSARAEKAPSAPVHAARLQYQQQQQQHLQQQQQHLLQLQQQVQRLQQLQCTLSSAESAEAAAADVAYEADVDEDVLPAAVADSSRRAAVASPLCVEPSSSAQRRLAERQHIYELFQPWALKNYGDQAKTKTITLRKKARILKALEGKEHSRPDSSKFRFWVKTKAFTTIRPATFEEAAGGQRRLKPLPPHAVLSDNPSDVDLFVASTSKDLGRRTYRKVAVVEEFFDIIYNVHMELGGRSGMHAGQKRTYRIITETYGFLPREAVTRFLSICPECKKNLRATSPATSSSQLEEPGNESSSEVEGLNYSSHTESSLEAGPTKLTATAANATATTTQTITTTTITTKRRHSHLEESESLKGPQALPLPELVEHPSASSATELSSTAALKCAVAPIEVTLTPSTTSTTTTTTKTSTIPTPTTPIVSAPLPASSVPKIRVRPQLQQPLTPPPFVAEPVGAQAPPPYAYHPLCFDVNVLKSRDSLFRYYEFMRRFYGGGGFPPPPPPPPPPPVSTAPPAPPLPPVRTLFPSSPLAMSPTSILGAAGLLQSLKVPLASTESLAKVSAMPLKEAAADMPRRPAAPEISAAGVDDVTPERPPLLKKFKISPDSAKSAQHAEAQATPACATPTTKTIQLELKSEPELELAPGSPPPPTQLSAINLSKTFFFRSTRSNGTTTTTTATATETAATSAITYGRPTTSTPTAAFKCEASTSAKAAKEAATTATATTTPQRSATASSRLPPLDLERLKPITSTYLQLTRSMGLSDEDALRFDNLVSDDFHYSL